MNDLAPRLRALAIEVSRNASHHNEVQNMLDQYLDFHTALNEWVGTTDYPDAADEILELMNELLPALPADSTSALPG